jgi:phospholipid/cholesterol/gamma-HCH transport system permease protein
VIGYRETTSLLRARLTHRVKPKPLRIDEERVGDGALRLHLSGQVNAATAGALHRCLRRLARRPHLGRVVLEFRGVRALDTAGIAVLSLAAARFAALGRALTIEGLAPPHRDALAMMPQVAPALVRPPRAGWFERIGDRAWSIGAGLRFLAALLGRTARVAGGVVTRRHRMPRGAVVEQAVVTGVDALGIIGLLSLLLGLILAFQAAYQLRQFGANIFVVDLVGISMVREFGPMMTGILLAGRSGAAIAAELGTMTVQEETDALRTMGIDPVRYLVLPRLLAMMIVQPALTLMSDLLGIVGGFVIAALFLDLSGWTFFSRLVEVVTIGDIAHGLLKSAAFAAIIGLTGCFTGLHLQGGPAAVGRATTRAVVASIFLIIVTDSAFAVVTTMLRYG